MVSEAQTTFFQEKGYLIIEGYLSAEDIDLLKQEAQRIISREGLGRRQAFSTGAGQQFDEYFMESAYGIRCFLEEGATTEAGELKVPAKQAVNKIGHALHDLNPVCERVSYRPALWQLARAAGLASPAIVQSQFIFKQPAIGGRVSAHIDSTFLYTRPLSCLGAWMALEDANVENGCLYVIPSSQKLHPLYQRFVRDKEGKATAFIDIGENRIDWTFQPTDPRWQALEVKAGSLVLLHGELIHASPANRSAKSRQAYVLHLADLNCHWAEDNWLQRPSSYPFRPMANVIDALKAG